MASGPLAGLRVLEMAGLGPAPFCAMLLSDLGADVVRVDRPGAAAQATPEMTAGERVTGRGRRSVALDLKTPAGVETCLALAARAELLIEGFRPGVMERLGLGPDACLARNPALVYGRMTGWGQTGPLAPRAGHDINYLSLTGALHAIGTEEKPVPPLNLVADFGGGSLYLAMGLLAALVHARATGEGQVIDCAMTDGAASLMSFAYGFMSAGHWVDRRRANRLDGGTPWYDTYQCADGGWVAVGPLEPQFYAVFCQVLGLDPATTGDRADPRALRQAIDAAFRTRTRDDWCARFEETDACVSPVLTMAEAPNHPHNKARGTFVERNGVIQPAPAPRFSRTPSAAQGPTPSPGADTEAVLADWLSPKTEELTP